MNATAIDARMFAAYQRGRAAFTTGARCPYHAPTFDQAGRGVTFSATWSRLWTEGYSDARDGKPNRYSIAQKKTGKGFLWMSNGVTEA